MKKAIHTETGSAFPCSGKETGIKSPGSRLFYTCSTPHSISIQFKNRLRGIFEGTMSHYAENHTRSSERLELGVNPGWFSVQRSCFIPHPTAYKQEGLAHSVVKEGFTRGRFIIGVKGFLFIFFKWPISVMWTWYNSFRNCIGVNRLRFSVEKFHVNVAKFQISVIKIQFGVHLFYRSVIEKLSNFYVRCLFISNLNNVCAGKLLSFYLRRQVIKKPRGEPMRRPPFVDYPDNF